MITLNEFIEKSKTAWMAARGIIQCLDDPDDPTELKLDMNNPRHRLFAKRFDEMGVNQSDIKYHVLFLTTPNVGYKSMHIYLRANKSVLCVEFGSCSKTFLNITDRLGMVNGVSFKRRKRRETENAEVFFFE